jgi:hypothetical protein
MNSWVIEASMHLPMDGTDSPSVSTDVVLQNHGNGKLKNSEVTHDQLHRGGRIQRCICHLHIELMVLILEHLSVADFLSFLSFCRCWRIAFSRFPLSFFDRLQGKLPCVVFLKANSSTKGTLEREVCCFCPRRHLFHATGKIGDPITQQAYNVSELQDKRLLLSK